LIQWQRPALSSSDRRYVEVIAELRPCFLCIGDDELRDLLRRYFFRNAFNRDPLMLHFELCFGKRSLVIENTEKEAELIAVLSLLKRLSEQATVKEKERASEYVGLFSDMAIFLMARESDFNEIKFLLAFLAKRAWNLYPEEAEDFMKSLEAVSFEAVYWR